MAAFRNAWVTVVFDETSCLQALVLMKSLRRAMTVADIVVLVSKGLPKGLRSVLCETFDSVIDFERNNELVNCISTLNEGKMYACTLTMFHKCVVLDPTLLVLKNCDELFMSTQFSMLAISNDYSDVDSSVLTIDPSQEVYEKISNMIQLSSDNKKDENIGFMNVLKSIFDGQIFYCNKNTGHLNYYKGKICNSAYDKPWRYVHQAKDNFSNMITNWLSIFECEVLPFLNSKKLQIKLNGNLEISILQNEFQQSVTKEGITKSYHKEIKESIAIIGQSVRLPGANNAEEFWRLLETGGDGISHIPMDRLLEHQKNDPQFTSIKAGFLKCPIDEFDAKFFGISPREADYTDPQQRLMAEVAWEALEDATINPLTLKGSNTGVFSGVWTNDYENLVKENTPVKDFHHVVLGNTFSATSARISYFLGLNGPNVATESGCSSSMVALHLACDSLRKRETDLALATGVNLLICPSPHTDVPLLAKDGHCKTFDEKADGFARAEGVVVLVLKRFSDALRDDDRIYSIVRGSALSNEGTSSSFGTPSKHCQEIAIREALKASGVKPEDVDYVEAHGTGTPIGDPIEFAAISAGYKAERAKPLIVGSVKTNTGHTESAAGLTGVVKVMLAMENQIIPAHRNLTVLNPNIDLRLLPAIIPISAMSWPKNKAKRRLAGVSSFGISGTNVHVIIEEPPEIPKIDFQPKDSDRTHHLLTLSAKTENALSDLLANYSNHLIKHSELSCQDICFTANIGRQHMKHRIAIVSKDVDDLKHKLLSPIHDTQILANEMPKTVFLFTGQGSQYSGMAKLLYDTSPVFQQAFDICNEILLNKGSISLIDLLWGNDENNRNLNETIYSQTAIFCVEYSLFKLWESFGLKPDYVLGHSVGEFAAAVAANIMTLKDALSLLTKRSQLIHNLPPGGMLVVRSDKEMVKNLIHLICDNGEWLDIAVINSPHEVVIAGKYPTLNRFSELCETKNIRTQLLAASHAFHSRDMEAIMGEFETFANNISHKDSTCKYISGSTGKLMNSGDINAKYWKNHLRCTVDFTKGMKLVQEQGCNVFVENGAHPILLAIGMSNFPHTTKQKEIWLPSIKRNEDNWFTLLNSVSKLYISGVNIDWEGLDLGYSRKKVVLPHYPFQRQKYWIESKFPPLTKALHPLLGRKISLAAIKDSVYENTLDLNDFSYLKDHQVANVILLPGAAFLEIILAAGKEVLNIDLDRKSLVVTNFLIEAPMELIENKYHKIQVVVSKNDSNNLLVRVFVDFARNGCIDEKEWKLFASGIVATANKMDSIPDTKIEFETAKSNCNEEFCSEDFYKRTEEIGIKFGQTFKSISKISRSEKNVIVEIPFPTNAGSIQEYIYHPIVLDAMIQALGFSTGQLHSDLYLPVGMQKFVMLSKSNNSSQFFAHVVMTENNPDINVRLFDKKYNLLCYMEGINLVKTSISSFLKILQTQKSSLPGLYEVTWRSRESVFHSRIDLQKLPNLDLNELHMEIKEFIHLHADIEHSRRFIDVHCKYTILINFLKLGWKPKVGNQFNTKSFIRDLLLTRSQTSFIERLLTILVEDGYLARDIHINSKEWTVLKPLISLSEMIKARKTIYEEYCSLNCSFLELKVYLHCCENLADILQGKITGVNFLFGNEDPDLNPLVIFNKGNAVKLANLRAVLYLRSKFSSLSTSKDGSIVRILEIGGGSGATSNEILVGLKKQGIIFRYTFTDISPFFLQEAKQRFKEYSGMEYKILNIERDPKCQGFVPNSFDVVVAANVIHATEYLNKSLQNVRQLLAPKGILILQEMISPIRHADIVYGMVEGYWMHKDFEIRCGHPCVSQEVWNKLLLENGFVSVVNISHCKEEIVDIVAEATDTNPEYSIPTFPTMLQETPTKVAKWVMFSGENNDLCTKVKNLIEESGDGVVILNQSSSTLKYFSGEGGVSVDYTSKEEIHKALTKASNQFDVKGILILSILDDKNNQDLICSPLLYIAQYLSMNRIKHCKIITVTNGVHYIGDQKLCRPYHATVWGIMKSFFNECPDIKGIIIDLDPDSINYDKNSKIIFSEMWNAETETMVAYRGGKKYVLRFTSYGLPQAPLTIPNGRYKIVVPQSKKIDDVSFTSVCHVQLNSDQVEIAIKSVALNFRDIFVITKPETYKTHFEDVGTDFAGIITKVGSNVLKFKVGDEVFGISYCSSAASHILATCEQVTHKPKTLSFMEACTLPSVYLTAYYGLVTIAGLKSGETILIHVASGGVGLAAIQIAKDIGANIIATAGNERKRAYLRSIGVTHVFHSRNLSFGNEISRVTNGEGVDVVLNSLTGVGFKETTLNSCGKNARFLEIGKVNIWQVEIVKKLRPDVQYTIIDLEIMRGEDMELLNTAMGTNIAANKLKPLPYTMFVLSEIKEALNYFQKAVHIGKIVLKMPELNEQLGKSLTNDLLFNDSGTYLVTGGFGGIGLEVAKWMVNSGARNLVLVGRSAPDEQSQSIIKGMSNKGCRILSHHCDIGDVAQCEELFAKINMEMSPLRGVIHSAGILSDGVFINQTWKKFETVFNAKVNGGWNLHTMTKDLDLQYFVLFSSMAAMVGPLGQSNHCAANMFLDSLAHYRHSLGLPAQTINWGAWSDIGVAVNTVFGKTGALGVKPFSPSQGIAALKFCMSRPIVQLGVVELDHNEFIDSFSSLSTNLAELHDRKKITDSAAFVQSDEFFNDINKLPEDEKVSLIQNCIKSIIRQIMKLPESEAVDEYQTFSEMGLDSLMAVEMRNKLQQVLGKRLILNPTSLLDYPTLSSLTKYMLKLIMELKNEISKDKKDHDYDLFMQDSILPDYITQISDPVLPSQFKNILLTGATGHLGTHLLNEFNNNAAVNIYCLMRGKNLNEAENRLQENLNKFNLQGIVLNNVKIILGDVSELFLGMNETEYVMLATHIDAIFHSAVKANHIEKYEKSISKKGIRSVNVVGTLEILKFAAAYKTKRVFYASSFSAGITFGEDGLISDELPDGGNLGEGIDLGYAMTKFVGEKLMSQALKRRIPCTVLRFPSFIGHSQTGHFTTDANLLMNVLLSALRFKVFRNIPGGWYIMPVDIAAKISSTIFFNDAAELGLYNVVNSIPLTSNEFVRLAKDNGFEMELVDAKEFTTKIFAEGNSLMSIFKETFGDSDPFERINNASPVIKSALTDQKIIFEVSAKLRKAVLNIDSIIPCPSVSMSRLLKFIKSTSTGMLEL